MIIYRGVVLSTTILKGKGKESKERKKIFTFHFDFRGENMFFFLLLDARDDYFFFFNV